MLSKALQIAKKAHYGQKDKGGNAYIFHPLRVMMDFENEDEQVCAVLHDVIEDSHITLDDLRNDGIPENILSALDALTKRDNETYENFIGRILQNKLACLVKLADINDNMDISRIPYPIESDYARIEMYKKSRKRIMYALDKVFDE